MVSDSLQKERRLGNHAPLYNKTPVPVGADAASPSDFKSGGTSRTISWCVEKRMMFRPAK